MSFFTATSSTSTATWHYTQTPPVGPSNTGTLHFTYDPSEAPPGVIGGQGKMTAAGSRQGDPFCWVYSNGVLTWQLTNQGSQPETKTTFWANYNGTNGVVGHYCNYQIGFVLGGISATCVGP